jgi:bifunctional N-acetylglucosamine-1-phosphate-uridyltransferase/glucosamine-1-phosphate-acetyltransferase GlmU-like protein
MRAQGVETHKPLLDVGGVSSTVHVCQSLLRCGLDFTQMLLVVPAEREMEYLESLTGMPVNVVIQEEPLGTGDAVLCVLDHLDDAVQNVYVSFGSQTLVRNSSVRCSLTHHLANDLAFTLPTTIRDNPYAPLQRGMHGEVTGSIETYLEGADMPARGETNIGSYWATREALELVLREFRTQNWVPDAGRYATASGEFGYPNEMVRGCLAHGLKVDGIPCADPDEVVGIKTQENLEFIRAELIRRERFED